MSLLYDKYRPTNLDEMSGQNNVKKVLSGFFSRSIDKVPRVYLLQGDSGTGKTTTARIINDFFGVNEHCFHELDGANFNSVNDARAVIESTTMTPMFGDKVTILIDECHRLSKEAWDIFLKPTEDIKDHVIFIFATTEKQKIKKTIRDRCQVLNFNPLKDKDLLSLLKNICKKEEKMIEKEEAVCIVKKSEGSARRAISLLESIIDLDKDERMSVLESASVSDEESDDLKALFILLMNRGSWAEMAPILKNTKETPEGIRFKVLNWMSSCLLNNDGRNDNGHISNVISQFGDSFDGNDGRSKLVGACYDCSNG